MRSAFPKFYRVTILVGSSSNQDSPAGWQALAPWCRQIRWCESPGPARSMSRPARGTSRCLVLIDACLSVCLFSPLVVAYWRGTWQLLDTYLFPTDFGLSAWASFVIGTAITCALNLLQIVFIRHARPDKCGSVGYVLASRLYTVVFAFAVVNHWRGVWHVLSHYTGMGWESAGTSSLVGVAALAGLRTLRNTIAPPFIVVTDNYKEYYFIPTMFKSEASRRSKLPGFILDVLFSVLAVGSLVVFAWRGVWILLDIYLFPESQLWSATGSCVLGFAVVVLCMSVQPLAVRISKRCSPLLRVIFEDIFFFFSFFAAVNVWRGVWNVLDIFLFPEDYVLSNWVSHTAGLGVLLILYNGNSILVRGVFIDGEEEDGSGCLFQVEYFQKILQLQQEKKEKEAETSETTEQSSQLLQSGRNPKDVELQHMNSTTAKHLTDSGSRAPSQDGFSIKHPANKSNSQNVVYIDGRIITLADLENAPESIV